MDDLDEDGSFNLSGFALHDVSNTYLSEGSKQSNFDKKNKPDFPHKENFASISKPNEENKDELLKSNNAEEEPILSKSLFNIDVSLTENLKVKSIGNELAELQAAQFADGEFSRKNDQSFKEDCFTAIECSQQVQRIQLDQQKTEDANLETSCLNNSSNSYNGCGEFSNPDENIRSGNNFNQSLSNMTEKREGNLKSANISSPIIHDFPEKKSLSKTYLGDETSFSLSLSTIEYSQYQTEKTEDDRELIKKSVDSGENDPLEINKEISHQIEPPSDGNIIVNQTKLDPEKAHDTSSKEILSKSLFDIDVSITEKPVVKSIESELSEMMASQSVTGVPKEISSLIHEQTNVTECELEPEMAHDKSSKEILSQSLFDINVSLTEKLVVKSIESELSELLAPLSIDGVPKEKSSVIHETSASVTEVVNGSVFGGQEKAKEIKEKIFTYENEPEPQETFNVSREIHSIEPKPQDITDSSGESMIHDMKNNKTNGTVQMEETTETSLFLELSTFDQTRVEETEEISETAKTDKILETGENVERMDDVEPFSVDSIAEVQTQKEETAEISLSLEVSTVNDQTQVEESSGTTVADKAPEVKESIDGIEEVAVSTLEIETLKEGSAETSGLLEISSVSDQTHQEGTNAIVEDFKVDTPEIEDDISAVEPKSEDQIEANGPSADLSVPKVQLEPKQTEETVESSLFLEISSINDQTQVETIENPAIVDEIVKEKEDIKETSLGALSPIVNLKMKQNEETTETSLLLEVSTFNDRTQMVDDNETSPTNESEVKASSIEEVTSNEFERMDDIKEACMDSSVLKVHLESNDNEEIEETTSGNTTANIGDKTPEAEEAFSEDLSVKTSVEQERVDDIKSAEDHSETTHEDENAQSSLLLEVSSIKEQTNVETSAVAKLEDETPIEDISFEDATSFLAAEQEQMNATEEPSADHRVEPIHEEETSGTSFHLEVSSIDQTQIEETVESGKVKMSEIQKGTSDESTERTGCAYEAFMDSSLSKICLEPTQENTVQASLVEATSGTSETELEIKTPKKEVPIDVAAQIAVEQEQMDDSKDPCADVHLEPIETSANELETSKTEEISSRNTPTAKEPEQTMEDINESSKSSVTLEKIPNETSLLLESSQTKESPLDVENESSRLVAGSNLETPEIEKTTEDLVAEQIQFTHDSSGDICVPVSHLEPKQSETTQYETKDSVETLEEVNDPKIDVEYPEIQESNQSEDIFAEIESNLDEIAIEPRRRDDAKKRLSFTSDSDIFEEKATNEISNDVAVAEITITITPVEEAIARSSLRGQLPLGTISEENLSEDSEMDKENDGKTPPGKLRKKLRMAISDFDYISKEFKELQKFTKLELQTIKADLMAKSELNEQLTEANKMINKLKFSQDEMSHLKKENDSLKTENKKIKKECDLIKSKVVEEEILRESNEARWKRREEELQNSLEESWKSLDETQKRLSDALKVSSEDGSLQKISKDENERLKKELDEQYLLVEQLRLSMASSDETARNDLDLKEQLQEMIALKAELLSSVKSLEENILHKNEENLNLKDCIEDQKKAKEEILSYVKTLEECVVEKDEKLKNLNEELEEQIKNIEKKNQEIRLMQEFEESLSSSVKNLEKALKNKEEEYSELFSTLTAKEKEYEDSLNALNVLIQHQDSELNQLKRRSIKIDTDLSKTLIPNSTINDISLCMSVRESPVRKFLSPRKNLNTTNDSLSTTIPESMHSIYLIDKTIQQSEEFEPCDPLNDSNEQFDTPNSSQIEANFTFVEDPSVELNTIKSILNSEDVVNSVQGLVSKVVALKENLEESQREIASCQVLIDSFNHLFNHENLEPKALMEININKMAEIKVDELNFFESVLEYKNNNENLKTSVDNLHKEKSDRENELKKSQALIELINEAFGFDSQDAFANVERISKLKEVFPQSNLIDAIFECKNDYEKLQNLVENMQIESKNTENSFKKSLDFIESINKVFDFDGQDALPVIELNIGQILKLKEAFPQSNLIDAVFNCKNDNEKLQNLVVTLQNELDVKENELKKSLDSIELANTIFNSDGQDSFDFESNINRIRKLKETFPDSNLIDAIFDCKKSNKNLTRQLTKMKEIDTGIKEVQNCQDQLKDFILNFKSSIDSKLKEAIDLTSLTQTCENVEITDIQSFNLLVREIAKTCDFDDADIFTSLKMIKSYVNKNKQGVEMVLNLLNHSTDDFWNYIFEKIRSLQEELLEKYSFDEKVRELKNELSDADDFKQKFANELAALQPQNNVRDLMKLPLIELHAKMLSTIMEKEQILLDDMRKEYEDKLQVTSDQNKQIEEELKRCKLWISELESENEKINKECREIKIGSESVQETLHQKTTMLTKIKEELREASEKLNDRSSQVCYCNKSDLLSERFEDLSLLLKQKTESCEIYERKLNESSVKVIALEKLINDKEIEIKNLKNKLEAKAEEEEIKEKELKNTINTLSSDLKRLQNELNEAKKSKGEEKLEQEIADLKEKMKSDEKSFGTLRKNLLDDLKVKALRIKELESKVKATINEYKSILNMKNEECEKLENKNKEFHDFVNKLEKKHISSKEIYLKDKKKYDAQISTMSDQLKEVSDKLTQVDVRIKILEEIEKLLSTSDSDVIRVLKEKLSELKKIAESLEEEKDKCMQLDQENDDMCATLKHYEKENCDYINKVCDYEKIVEKYTSDLNEISSQNSNLLKKLEARNVVEEKLKNDLRQQETIFNQLEKKFEESQVEWEKKIINYEKTVENLGSDMKILTQKNEELQKRLDARNERQEECETELKKKDNFLRRSEERLKAYKKDYQNILEENQNLQAQIEIVNAKLTKALNDLTNAQLNPSAQTQNGKENNSLQKENVQLSCNLMALNEKNGKLEYEVESLKQALKEKNDSLSRYRSELENVKKQQGYRNFSLGLSRINNSGSDFENKLKECENKILTFEKENLILKKLAQKRLAKINLYEDRLKNLGCFSETDVPSSASLKPNMKPSQ